MVRRIGVVTVLIGILTACVGGNSQEVTLSVAPDPACVGETVTLSWEARVPRNQTGLHPVITAAAALGEGVPPVVGDPDDPNYRSEVTYAYASEVQPDLDERARGEVAFTCTDPGGCGPGVGAGVHLDGRELPVISRAGRVGRPSLAGGRYAAC